MERRSRRKFTPEFNQRTVELIGSSGKSIAQVCRELDLTESAVRRWVELAQIDRGEKEGLTNGEREELARLRTENRVLKEEREILKKAAVLSTRHGNTPVPMNGGGRGGGTTTDIHAGRAAGAVGHRHHLHRDS